MNDQQYIAERLDDQCHWLEGKAAWNQTCYKRLRLIEIAAAAFIPALASLKVPDPLTQPIVAVLGIAVALVAGAMGLFKFQENWVQYRSTAEQLKHEKFMYATQCGPYAGEDRFALLVERVEKLLMKENTAWAEAMSSRPAGQPAGEGAGAAGS
jgi:hypothetical protein